MKTDGKLPDNASDDKGESCLRSSNLVLAGNGSLNENI